MTRASRLSAVIAAVGYPGEPIGECVTVLGGALAYLAVKMRFPRHALLAIVGETFDEVAAQDVAGNEPPRVKG